MGSEGDLWAATPVRRAQLVKVLLDANYEVYLTVKVTFARNTTGLPQRLRTQEYEPEVAIVQQSHALTQIQSRELADALVQGGGYVAIDHDDVHADVGLEEHDGVVRDKARGSADGVNKHKHTHIRSNGVVSDKAHGSGDGAKKHMRGRDGVNNHESGHIRSNGVTRDKARSKDNTNKQKHAHMRSNGVMRDKTQQGGKKLKDTYTIDNTFMNPLIKLAPDGAGPLRFQAWNGQTVILALNNQTYSPPAPSSDGARCGRRVETGGDGCGDGRVRDRCDVRRLGGDACVYDVEEVREDVSESHVKAEKGHMHRSEHVSESHVKAGGKESYMKGGEESRVKGEKEHTYRASLKEEERVYDLPPQPKMNVEQWWSLCCEQVCMCVSVCVCVYV
jgi:hypothetical protein